MGAIAQAVAAIIGDSGVMPWDAVQPQLHREIQAAMVSPHGPDCVALPETAAALAEVMACAHHHRWRVLPMGNGSKIAWGGLVSGVDLVLSTARLNRVVEHAIGDLTLTVEAGTPFAAVQQQLATTRQFLALDPAYPQRATLGGIVATADAGAWRQRYGGVRDRVIGVSFVRYDGQLAKAGGRVVKNVAGYDLMKLMTGAYGTLGILTQITLRTYPMAAAAATVLLTGNAAAIDQLAAAVRQSALTPVALDVLSPGLLQEMGYAPTYGLALQLQGIAAGVEEQVDRLHALAAPLAVTPQVFSDPAGATVWSAVQQCLWPPLPQDEWAIALKVGTQPTAAITLLETLAASLPDGAWRGRIHGGSGIGTLRLQTAAATAELLTSLRGQCQKHGGYLTLLEGPVVLKRAFEPWGIPADSQGLMQRLHQPFDPHHNLSPGRFF